MTTPRQPACSSASLPMQPTLAILPGLMLCLLLSSVAVALETAENRIFGKAWLESLNLALVLGVGVRTACKPGPMWAAGIRFCSRTLLNVAIVFLGATFAPRAIFGAGFHLLLGVMLFVPFSMVLTLVFGQLAGLPIQQRILVACGNAICGNSAIMAAAPIIQARDEDIGSTIAFTAAGGLVVVLVMPFLVPTLNLGPNAQGTLAGLSVYAVPQVVAAAAPFGPAAIHTGTLVKLMRVLMLGPVCLALSLFVTARTMQQTPERPQAAACPPAAFRLVPWYILGFVGMMTARAIGLVPQTAVEPLTLAATTLTIMAMAALGLSVDLRAVLRAGRAMALTVLFSLIGLIGASVILVRLGFGA